MTDELTMDMTDFIKEIDEILSSFAANAMGDFVKIDDVNDLLLDLRQKASSQN